MILERPWPRKQGNGINLSFLEFGDSDLVNSWIVAI